MRLLFWFLKQDDETATTLPSTSPIDLHLTHLIPILDDDIFGRVAQQRQSEDYRPKSALSEAKTCKSYDTFEILARSVTFLPCLSIHVLVSPMVDKLDNEMEYADEGSVAGVFTAPTIRLPIKVEDACRNVLRRIAIGLSNNQSVQAEPLMVYIHSLLTKYLPKSVKRDTRGETSELSSSTSSTSSTSSSSKRKRDNQNDDDDTMKEKELPTNTPNDTHLIPTAPILAGAFRHTMFMARSSVFHHVWVEYALTMLHSAFRRRVLSKKRHTHLLQPFAMILARCLKLSKENKGK